jgi:hypothetical protein
LTGSHQLLPILLLQHRACGVVWEVGHHQLHTWLDQWLHMASHQQQAQDKHATDHQFE